MAHVIPTLRTTSRAAYAPTVTRRNSDTPAATTDPARAADFRTLFKSQSGTNPAVSSGQQSNATTAIQTSLALSGSFLRNQTAAADRSGVASAGTEAVIPAAASSRAKNAAGRGPGPGSRLARTRAILLSGNQYPHAESVWARSLLRQPDPKHLCRERFQPDDPATSGSLLLPYSANGPITRRPERRRPRTWGCSRETPGTASSCKTP